MSCGGRGTAHRHKPPVTHLKLNPTRNSRLNDARQCHGIENSYNMYLWSNLNTGRPLNENSTPKSCFFPQWLTTFSYGVVEQQVCTCVWRRRVGLTLFGWLRTHHSGVALLALGSSSFLLRNSALLVSLSCPLRLLILQLDNNGSTQICWMEKMTSCGSFFVHLLYVTSLLFNTSRFSSSNTVALSDIIKRELQRRIKKLYNISMDFIYFFLLSFDNDIYKILGYVFSTFWHRF